MKKRRVILAVLALTLLFVPAIGCHAWLNTEDLVTVTVTGRERVRVACGKVGGGVNAGGGVSRG
jgi:hypothetical protein